MRGQAVLSVLIWQCFVLCNSQNVETRIHRMLEPDSNGVDFGRSLQGFGWQLYVGAPNMSLSGGMYECGKGIVRSLGKTSDTKVCSNNIDFTEESPETPVIKATAVGSSLVKVKDGGNIIVACGNQHSFECKVAGSNTSEQRMVGRCNAYDIGEGVKQVIKSPCPTACPFSADIVFVIDGSGSVNEENYKKGLRWIANVMKKFSEDINKRRVQVGFVPFSGTVDAENIVDLTAGTYEELKAIVIGLPYPGGGTNTAAAIEQAREFLTSDTARENVAKLMITLTDGQSYYAPENEAAKSERANITMVAVGIGHGIVQTELQQIARYDDSRILKVESYSALDGLISKLSQVIEDAAVSLEGQDTNSTNELNSCQFGTSIHASKTGLYVGAVGSYNRIGTVAEYRSISNFPKIKSSGHLNSTEIKEVVGNFSYSNLEEYFGYSVSSGKFTNDESEWIVTAGPRYLLKGTVLIYRENPTASYYTIHPRVDMWQLGAYFGHSLLTVDVNNDGLDDLLVSSPLFSEMAGYDEGRVFLFLNDKNASGPSKWSKADYSPIVLKGGNVRGARFGMNLVNGGDIDRNNIDDVIISAPAEGSTGMDTQSGAIYIYFATNSGLSDSRTQKILGRSVSTVPLSQFGWSVTGGMDFDENGYFDIAVSAPSSEKVVLLRSRRIIKLNSQVTVNPKSINVPQCAINKSSMCSNVTVCFNISYQDGSVGEQIDLSYSLDLDSLVPRSKRLRFMTSRDNPITKTILVGRKQTCETYSMQLNTENLGELSVGGGFQVTPRVALKSDLSAQHKATVMSGVLGYGTETENYQDSEFVTGCRGVNGRCEHDLEISVHSPHEGNSTPIILTDETRKLVLSFTIENKGRDQSYFTKLNITSGNLSLIIVNGTCVTLNEDATKASEGRAVINYKSGSSFLADLMVPKTTCTFIVEFDFSKMKTQAVEAEYKVEGVLYSSVGANFTSDPNEENNKFSLSHAVQYKSSILIGKASIPQAIYFDRTTTDTMQVTSLEDTAFAGNKTGLIHEYSLYNRGPLSLVNSKVKLQWPEKTTSGLDLLYLIDIRCQPKEACVCNKNGKANKFNIKPENSSVSTSSYVASFTVTHPPDAEAFGAVTNVTCQNAVCSVVWCDLSPISRFATVKVLAEFKPWIPSFGTKFTYTEISSNLTLVVSNVTPLTVQTSMKVPTTLSTSPLYKKPSRKTDIPWWIILLAVLGGLLLLVAAVLIMKKAGFFESKYKNKTRAGRASVRETAGRSGEAPEDLGEGPEDLGEGPAPQDPGMGRSTVDLVND